MCLGKSKGKKDEVELEKGVYVHDYEEKRDLVENNEEMDGALAHVLGAVPIEVSQLRSALTRNCFRLFLVGSFVISLILLVYFGFRNTRRAKFISVSRDGNSIKCEKVRQPQFSGSFELDADGLWSTENGFEETKSILRFDFVNFPAKKYEDAMVEAEERVRQSTDQKSYLQNILFAAVWKSTIIAGDGSLTVSLAADASALFGGASSYLVSPATCPSALYSPDYLYAYTSESGAFVGKEKYEYHVESLENGRLLRGSWPRDSFEGCTPRPWLALPRVEQYLSSITNNPVDNTISLDLDWYSVAAASAINENVLKSPFDFMELVSTFTLPAINTTSSSESLYDDYFDSEFEARAYFYDYWQGEVAYRWNYRIWPIYEDATVDFCPAEFFLPENTREEAQAFSVFRDPRVSDMQDLVCHFDESTQAWTCAIVIGSLHVYPQFGFTDTNCNVCHKTGQAQNLCTSNQITGMIFLKDYQSQGGFTTKPYETSRRDAYWLDVSTKRRPSSSNTTTYTNDIPGIAANLAQLDLQGPATPEITTYASCALDFDGLAIGISAISSSTLDIPRRTNSGATASPDSWHCVSDFLDIASSAIDSALDHAPVNFFENYYECQTKRLPAMIDAFGIGFSNARTFVYIIALIMAFILIKVFPNRAYLNNTVVSESEIQDHARLLTIQAKLENPARFNKQGSKPFRVYEEEEE